jgi:hypothetical protein
MTSYDTTGSLTRKRRLLKSFPIVVERLRIEPPTICESPSFVLQPRFNHTMSFDAIYFRKFNQAHPLLDYSGFLCSQ